MLLYHVLEKIFNINSFQIAAECIKLFVTRMWVKVQRDGRPADYRWRPLCNAAKFG